MLAPVWSNTAMLPIPTFLQKHNKKKKLCDFLTRLFFPRAWRPARHCYYTINSALKPDWFLCVNWVWYDLANRWPLLSLLRVINVHCKVKACKLVSQGSSFPCYVDENFWCDNSNESYWAALSCGTVYNAVQGGSNFWVCGWNPKVWPFKWKLLSSTFLWYRLLCCTRWF